MDRRARGRSRSRIRRSRDQISDAMGNVVEGGRVTAEGARQLEAAVSNLNALAQRLDATLASYKT